MNKIRITSTNKLLLTVVLLLTVFPLLLVTVLYYQFGINIRDYIEGKEESKALLLAVNQYGFILLPAVIFLLANRLNIRNVLRLNPINIPTAVLTVIIAFAVWFISQYLTIIIYHIYSSLFGPPGNNLEGVIPENMALGFLLIALSPAICEEVLFRGVALKAYENRGTVRAIVISSIFFALVHQSVVNFIGPLLIGALAAYLVIRSDSIIPGILTHFTFNATSMLIYYYNQRRFPEEMGRFPTIPEYIALLIFVAFSAVVVAIGIIAFIYFTQPRKRMRFESPIKQAFYNLIFLGTPEEQPRIVKPVGSVMQDIISTVTHWPIAVSLIIISAATILSA